MKILKKILTMVLMLFAAQVTYGAAITAVTITAINVNPCVSSTSGKATAYGVGAIAATDTLTYLWSTGSTSSRLSPIGVGTYTVTVTQKNNGIIATKTATVTIVNTAIQPSYITGPTNVCAFIGVDSTIYSVPEVKSGSTLAKAAAYYVWTLPVGVTPTASSNDTTTSPSIRVNFSSSFVSGTAISVYAVSCIPSNSASRTKILNTSAVANPGTITGANPTCADISGLTPITYSIAAVNGASSYIWTLPTGATGTSTTNSINVIFDGTFVNGNIGVLAVSSCANSGVRYKAVSTASAIAKPSGFIATGSNGSVLSGTTSKNVCMFYNTGSVVFNVTNDPAMTYTWTLPVGATAVAPSTSNEITVTFGTGFISYTPIKVNAVNACNGTGPELSMILTSDATRPGSITGSTSVCSNIGGAAVTYSITPVTGATQYIWGWLSNQAYGSTPLATVATSTVTSADVTYLQGFKNGKIWVSSKMACGNSKPAISALIVGGLGERPKAIVGETSVCQFVSGSPTLDSTTYSVAAIAGATSYSWTLPTGVTATATSATTTNTIRVKFAPTYTTGIISVKAVNACSNGLPVSARLVAEPIKAGYINGPSGISSFLGGTAVSYSIKNVANATSYTWTVPANTTIASGQGTSVISVLFPAAFDPGSITVTANNLCGSGAVRALILRNSASYKTSTLEETLAGAFLPGQVNNFAAEVFPNPCASNFNLAVYSSIDEEIVVSIYSMDGRLIDSQIKTAGVGYNEFSNSVSSYDNGIYLMKINGQTNGQQIVKKFFVQN